MEWFKLVKTLHQLASLLGTSVGSGPLMDGEIKVVLKCIQTPLGRDAHVPKRATNPAEALFPAVVDGCL